MGTAAGLGTRSTTSAGCCAPGQSCSPTDNATGSPPSSRCRPTSRSRRPGGSTSASSPPTDTPTGPPARPPSPRSLTTSARDVPPALTELIILGRTLRRRAGDVLAYFDRPGTSNGPTEAINSLPRTPPRHRPGLPQPHQLHPQITARHRRVPTPTTSSSAVSRSGPDRRRSDPTGPASRIGLIGQLEQGSVMASQL